MCGQRPEATYETELEPIAEPAPFQGHGCARHPRRVDGLGPVRCYRPAIRSVSVMPGPWPSRMNHSVPKA
ncbi:hypothetical protein SAMN04489726_2641 [Allokutzneria albata]|uniref:Uncharacterized protein n=1 Tax=Allokutzneria albata TaxID=211114 RepID=A0A1G9UUQ8_ALLAB|nr:hypothetical protein SAMN04489726_2641 [Allokutzneria albata]